jgi:hypothetical protein
MSRPVSVINPSVGQVASNLLLWARPWVVKLAVPGAVHDVDLSFSRGFLDRSGRRAAVLTGAFHAIFHLPLLVLTTTYQSEGKRWIVVPIVMVTLTLAGVWYGWLRLWSGSIWPVSLSHSAFNNVIEGVAGAAIATSPAMMAYVTTETGVVTMIIMVLVAGYLLTRRAADFHKAEPQDARPTSEPSTAGRRAHTDDPS